MTAAPRPPAELAYLVDALGAEGTLLLIEQRGGTRVYVAAEPNQGSDLARLVGLNGARALAATHGGDWIKVPLARDWRIRLYRARGDTQTAIARRLGIHESTVARHLTAAGATHSHTASDNQPDLFG